MNKPYVRSAVEMANKLFTLIIHLGGKGYIIHVYERSVRASNGGVAYSFDVLERTRKNHHHIIFTNMVGSFSPCHASDGKDAKRQVLEHLAMKPGDTDDEFFEGYSQEQLDFVNGFSDEIQTIAWERYGER